MSDDYDLDWIYDVEQPPEEPWPISPDLKDVLPPEEIGKNKEQK